MAVASKKFIIAAVLVAAVGATIFVTKRRTPACLEGGKFMSTQSECVQWGIAEGVCKEAIDKAQAAIERVAPKTETMFQCEVRFAECFERATGGFSPRPSFCLREDAGAEPKEVRYLEYESDRRNRKKTKEVRLD